MNAAPRSQASEWLQIARPPPSRGTHTRKPGQKFPLTGLLLVADEGFELTKAVEQVATWRCVKRHETNDSQVSNFAHLHRETCRYISGAPSFAP